MIYKHIHLRFPSHNQLYMFCFSDVNLLSSSPDTTLNLWCKALGMSPVKHKSRHIKLKWHSCFSKCYPCCQNKSECTQANFGLQTKKWKNVDFGRISGFHKNVLIKPSSSNPSAPNSNWISKMIFIHKFSERSSFSSLASCTGAGWYMIPIHTHTVYTELQHLSRLFTQT